MTRRIFVIANPVAGSGRGARYRAAVAEYLKAHGYAAEFCDSQSSEAIRRQAAAAARAGCRYVVALGGDGTFHHLVEGIRGTGAVAGIFPAGNGNDAARALGIPPDPIRGADAFLRSSPKAIDLIRAQFTDGRVAYSVCAAGMGLDAEAADLANTRFQSWPGVTRYLAGALRTFRQGAAFDLHANIDGAEWSGRALLAVVANVAEYGSGVRIAPAARMDDEWLELVIVRDLPWVRLIDAIPIVLTSGNVRFPELERFRCKRVTLEAGRQVKVHGDGEILGTSPVQFEVVAKGIQVMAPDVRSS